MEMFSLNHEYLKYFHQIMVFPFIFIDQAYIKLYKIGIPYMQTPHKCIIFPSERVDQSEMVFVYNIHIVLVFAYMRSKELSLSSN